MPVPALSPEIWHLMEKVLGIPPAKIVDHAIARSFVENGIESFCEDFTVLSDKDIADLYCKDHVHGKIQLSIAECRMVAIALAAWHDMSRSIATPADLGELTKAKVDDYRIK